MLLHWHEHSCCTVMLWTACSLRYSVTRSCEQLLIIFGTVSTNYVMLCVLVSNQLYAHLNTISNRIWICVAIIYHLRIQIKLLSAILWPLWSCTCEKLISKLWWIDVMFVTKVMVNLWPFYIKRWQWQITFCDDINLSSMTIPKWWHQLPRHWWRQRHVSCHVIADVSATSDANAVNGRLWRKRIVTKWLTALTATSVSQADVKLWRK
jgi:hypothetical protein